MTATIKSNSIKDRNVKFCWMTCYNIYWRKKESRTVNYGEFTYRKSSRSTLCHTQVESLSFTSPFCLLSTILISWRWWCAMRSPMCFKGMWIGKFPNSFLMESLCFVCLWASILGWWRYSSQKNSKIFTSWTTVGSTSLELMSKAWIYCISLDLDTKKAQEWSFNLKRPSRF